MGWDVNSDISLEPQAGAPPLKDFLNQLLSDRRQLQIRLLIWDWAFIYGFDRQFMPQLRFGLGGSRRLKFVFDGDHPPGACQHEKLVVIDGELAFCGGIDLTVGRWDTPAHRPDEPHRQFPSGTPKQPFHDCMLMVEGETAQALDELARERWRRASGERVAAPAPDGRARRRWRRTGAKAGVAPAQDHRTPWPEVGRALARERPGRDRAHPPQVRRPAGGPRGRGALSARDRERPADDLHREPVSDRAGDRRDACRPARGCRGPGDPGARPDGLRGPGRDRGHGSRPRPVSGPAACRRRHRAAHARVLPGQRHRRRARRRSICTPS